MPRERCPLPPERAAPHAQAHTDPARLQRRGKRGPYPRSPQTPGRAGPGRAAHSHLRSSRVAAASRQPGCTKRNTAARGAGHGHGQAWARYAALAPGLGTITGGLGRFSPRRAQVRRAWRGVEGGDTSGSAPNPAPTQTGSAEAPRPRSRKRERRRRRRAGAVPRRRRGAAGPGRARWVRGSRAVPAAVPAPGAWLQLAGALGPGAASRPPVAEAGETRCGLAGGRGCPGAGKAQPGPAGSGVFVPRPFRPQLAGEAQRDKMLANTH